MTASRPVGRLTGAVDPFDGVVLDAPCTGEGLFRRRPAAIRDWSPAAVAGSARRQARLLDEAAQLVRPYGVLVYSTCTFNREENEDRVAAFLDDHPEWTIDPLAGPANVDGAVSGVDGLGVRLWPHRVDGEGQYVARLRAPGTWSPPPRVRRPVKEEKASSAVRQAWRDFCRTALRPEPEVELPEGELIVRGDTVYLAPTDSGVDPAVPARPGLPLGRARPGRFEPAPALATSLIPDDAALTRRTGPGVPDRQCGRLPGPGWLGAGVLAAMADRLGAAQWRRAEELSARPGTPDVGVLTGLPHHDYRTMTTVP